MLLLRGSNFWCSAERYEFVVDKLQRPPGLRVLRSLLLCECMQGLSTLICYIQCCALRIAHVHRHTC